MPSRTTSSGSAAILTMAVAVLCFYIGDNQTKFASKDIVVTQVLFFRTLIALVILGCVYIGRRNSPTINVFNDIFLLLQGVALVATIISFAISFHYSADMTPIYVISFLWPGFLILLETVIMRTEVRRKTIVLTLIMYVGVLVFFLTPLRLSFRSFFTISMAPAYCTAIGYAAFVAFSSRTKNNSRRLDKTFGLYTITALCLAAICVIQFWRDPVLPAISTPVVRAIGIAGVASFLGLVLLLRAASMKSAADIAAIDFTVVIWAYLYDTVYGDEPFDIFQLLGVTIILGGAIAMMFTHPKKVPSEHQ